MQCRGISITHTPLNQVPVLLPVISAFGTSLSLKRHLHRTFSLQQLAKELFIVITQFHRYFPSNGVCPQTHQDLGITNLDHVEVLKKGPHSSPNSCNSTRMYLSIACSSFGKFAEVFLTVPHSVWLKLGNTHHALHCIYVMILTTKKASQNYAVVLWGSGLCLAHLHHFCFPLVQCTASHQASVHTYATGTHIQYTVSLSCCAPELSSYLFFSPGWCAQKFVLLCHCCFLIGKALAVLTSLFHPLTP